MACCHLWGSRLRIRRLSNSKDSARIRSHLAKLVQKARAWGDEDITLDVGRICQEVGLKTEDAFVVCCNLLDSERFARSHRLWYHHRTGIWGTEEARYTFLLDMSGHRGATGGARWGGWSWLQLILLALIAGATAGMAAVVVMQLIG